MDTRQPITREVEDSHLGGTFLITASPLLQAAGQMRGCVYIARDITEFKRLEVEAWQRRRFEDLSRAKSAFIATMSHELRTPLNAVIGFSDLLREERVGPLTEKQTRYVDHIQKAGKHLLALIGDILDLSKVESGKIVLQLESLAVTPLLEDVLVIARGLANQKGQEIRTEIASDLPPLIADPLRLKQICFNLLSNAVKFTPDGGTITVTARKASGHPPSAGTRGEGEPDVEFLEIRVTDTGIGIKPEDLPRLFREFVRLETTRTQAQEGTGLGLALTKNLVELHGGRIWAASEGEGRGSTFAVILPFAGVAPRPAP
jgi:signal transduction histidine kinase